MTFSERSGKLKPKIDHKFRKGKESRDLAVSRMETFDASNPKAETVCGSEIVYTEEQLKQFSLQGNKFGTELAHVLAAQAGKLIPTGS